MNDKPLELPGGTALASARPLSRRKKVLFSLMGAMLMAGIVEGVCGVVWTTLRPDRLVQEEEMGDRFGMVNLAMVTEPDSRLFWQWKRNAEAPRDRGRLMGFIANSDRMRNPETPVPRGPNDFRVLCLGDSNTFGWGVQYEEAFPTVLQGLLSRALPEHRVIVLNAGCTGYSAHQGLEVLRERGLKYRPDVVTIWFGWNDSATWDGLTDAEHAEAFRQEHWLNFSATYRVASHVVNRLGLKRLDRQRGRQGHPRMPLADYERCLADMVKLSRGNRIDETGRGAHVVMILGCYKPQLARAEGAWDAHQQAMRETAAELSVPVLDVREALRQAGLDESVFVDRGHVDARGHRAIAEALGDLLRREQMLPVSAGSQRLEGAR